jgi:hypothetical protein
VSFGADRVSVQPGTQTLEASGHVHVDETPFHLTSDALCLHRTRSTVLVSGEGRLAFCSCLGTPLAVRFTGATLAPPDDIIVRNPVVEVFGVPVAWAPAWWLRSAGRVGLVAPDVAWRGSDGLRLGDGVHVPWSDGDQANGLDLRASAYLRGGALLDARLRTHRMDTQIQWDRLGTSDGLVVASHGATRAAERSDAPVVAWDVDALRGLRAVQSTSDLDAASRPFDRAEAGASWRADETLWVSGARSVAVRGSSLGALGATGPFVAVRRADAIGRVGTYDAAVEAGALNIAGHATTTFARAETDALVSSGLGPFESDLSVRLLAAIADDGLASTLDGAAQARASVGLPLGREFSSSDPSDPWLHLTQPRLEAAVLATDPGTTVEAVPDRGLAAPRGGAWVGAATWQNALARWGARESMGVDVSLGVLGTADHASPLARAHLAAHEKWLGGQGDFARVVDRVGHGGAFIARVRMGPASGLHFAVHVAERDGVDPVSARALVDPVLEPSTGFLGAPGWSGAALAAVPLGARLAVLGGAHADLDRRTLVASMGSLEVHDPCRCVVARLTASQRLGREGVDVWATVELAR